MNADPIPWKQLHRDTLAELLRLEEKVTALVKASRPIAAGMYNTIASTDVLTYPAADVHAFRSAVDLFKNWEDS